MVASGWSLALGHSALAYDTERKWLHNLSEQSVFRVKAPIVSPANSSMLILFQGKTYTALEFIKLYKNMYNTDAEAPRVPICALLEPKKKFSTYIGEGQDYVLERLIRQNPEPAMQSDEHQSLIYVLHLQAKDDANEKLELRCAQQRGPFNENFRQEDLGNYGILSAANCVKGILAREIPYEMFQLNVEQHFEIIPPDPIDFVSGEVVR